MKTNEIRITIDAEPKDVFEFTVEPKNTAKWIDTAGEEHINTEQIGLGTVYSNNYGDLKVTDYERNKFFELTNEATSYCCSYTYRKLEDDTTELTYFEYMQDGSELEDPMDRRHFEKLQEIISKN
jgi:hypothetical protein